MKTLKSITAVILVLTLMMSVCISASATDKNVANSSCAKVKWVDLPDAYKSFVSKDAIITMQPDGSYDVVQKGSGQANSTPNSVMKPSLVPERNAPNGGTYTNFSNHFLPGSTQTIIVSQSYVPADGVGIYLVKGAPNLFAIVRDWFIAFGASTAITKLANHYGIKISTTAMNLMMTGYIYIIETLDYNSVMNISNGGANGIKITYVTTPGLGNMRLYDTWSLYPSVPYYPNGGTASWQEGVWTLMPQ